MPRGAYDVVPLLGLLLGGCYLSHGGSDTGARDAGLDARVGLPDVSTDALETSEPPIPPRDGGLPDAGPACRAMEDVPQTLCSVSPTGDLVSGRPFELGLRWSRCRCEGARSCEVRVDGGIIDVRTDSCGDEIPCDDCSFETSCSVPALSEGTYIVRVDGVPTYGPIRARPPDGPRRSEPRCYELPTPPDASLFCAAPDARIGPGEVCFRPTEDVGSFVRFTVQAGCRGCFDWTAGCAVTRAGLELRVAPLALVCECPTCGVCAEVCTPITIECRSAALRDGIYDVVLVTETGSHDVGTLEVADVTTPGAPVCVRFE